MRRVRSWATVGAALVVVLMSSRAAGYSLLGGRILEVHSSAARASVGYPDIRLAYHIPVLASLEVTPRLIQTYGLDTHAPVVGNAAGVEIRWHLWQSGAFDLALFFEPEIFVFYKPGTAVGFSFGLPGARAGYAVTDAFAVVGGLRVPIAMSFYPDVVARIPIMFEMGAELGLSTELNAFLLLGIGPDVYAGGGGSRTELYINVSLGAGYRF